MSSTEMEAHHPVLAARDFCLKIASARVDADSFKRVADAFGELKIDRSALDISSVDDLGVICRTLGFIVASDHDGCLRAYLPGEWPVNERQPHELRLEPQPIADQWRATCICGWASAASFHEFATKEALLKELRERFGRHMEAQVRD